MIFNEFIFVPFLGTALLAFALLRGPARTPLLIAASLLFYGLSGLEHLLVLVGTIVWVWVLTRDGALIRNRSILAASIVGPLAALVWYKYAAFLWSLGAPGQGEVRESFSLFGDVLLPAGISFFTFQLASLALVASMMFLDRSQTFVYFRF